MPKGVVRRTVLVLAGALAVSSAVASPAALGIVGGVRDCSANALHQAGGGCTFVSVGTLARTVPGQERLRSVCTQRLVYNGIDKATILTAAHCVAGTFNVANGDGVIFDSQVVDDSVTPYARAVLLPERVIPADHVILHPYQASGFTPGTGPLGNSQSYTANDLALLVIDDPDKLLRMRSLWDLPEGRLVDLPSEGHLDSLSPTEFRQLPLLDVGYGSDWVDETGPSGRVNRGHVRNAGFRSVANITPTGLSAERILTSQNQQKDLEGICYGDSGSSAFTMDPETGRATIFALPTWVNDGGTKCHSTVQWMRLDRPNALAFVGCAFTPGPGQAVRDCVERALPAR